MAGVAGFFVLTGIRTLGKILGFLNPYVTGVLE